jgi:hypothetical protein
MSAPPSRPGLSLSDAGWAAVCCLAAEAGASPAYPYPWDGLEADLRRQGRPLLLVAYGSLMNAPSAAQTLRPSAARRPVVAFGVRRVFNYCMAEASLARYGSCDTQERAALNVYRSAAPADMVNGVGLEVPAEEVRALRQRELGYDLYPVACLWWDAQESPPLLAHILGTPDQPRQGPRYTRDDLRPHPAYYRLCRAGAASFSAAFLDFYLDSTYLADRSTNLRAWERAGTGS